jgi:hypothetical protein
MPFDPMPTLSFLAASPALDGLVDDPYDHPSAGVALDQVSVGALANCFVSDSFVVC